METVGPACGRASGAVIGKIIHWSGMCRGMGVNMGRGRGWTRGDKETVIRFGTYDILNGIKGELKSALR